MFCRGKHDIYKLSRAGISKGCDFEGSVKQSMVFTVFSMVFTTAVELAFRRDSILKAQSTKAWYLLCLAWLSRAVFRSHCDFEGSVEQSVVFTVSSKAQPSWLIKVTAILKAQSSKAWYLLCLARYLQAQSSWLFEVTAILKAQSSQAWYLQAQSSCHFEGMRV